MSGLTAPDGLRSSEQHMSLSGSGGAPTVGLILDGAALKSDAVAQVSHFLERSPNVRRVVARWHGSLDSDDVRLLNTLKERSEALGAPFSLDLVLDAKSNASGIFKDSGSLPTRALHREIAARWLVPLAPELIHHLETMFSLALDRNVDAVLVPPGFLDSHSVPTESSLNPDQRRFAWDFITYRLLEEDRHGISATRIAFYRTLQRALLEERSWMPRGDEKDVAVLRSDDGKEWSWRSEKWPALGDRENDSREGRASDWLGDFESKLKEVSDVLVNGIRAVSRSVLTKSSSTRRKTTSPAEPLRSVLIIGAYGGEHIGDAAILGGVLCRLRDRHGTKHAIVMSQRPDHTRHLISMLEVPVELQVRSYEPAEIRASLRLTDAVVFAGGPLIDLPRQLVRHLYAASLARRAGKPFMMEGIGPGPFIRWPSQWIARRLAKMADRLSVRTSDDAQSPLVRDLSPVAGHDPAFDYLATRRDPLTRLPVAEEEAIAALLSGTEGRPLIGVNVRPIRHLFTADADGRDRAEYTRLTEARFEQELADGLRSFDRVSPIKPCFVFYPMNAIQFGLSDLRSAYRIGRLLDERIDFRVWEADASLDGVIALLRRLDAVIAMRFHAAIFALSQQRPVIGIDYRIGKRDKVAALLDDCGQGINCRRIDELTGEWLSERLTEVAGESLVLTHDN